MKKFSQFIQEAHDSLSEFVDKKKNLAIFNAKRNGWISDGHGSWYNPETGEREAESEITNGGIVRLKIDTRNQKLGKKDPKQNRKIPSRLAPPSHQVAEEISVVFGRFNPPTVGHQRLFDVLSEVAENNDYRIYPSRSNDSKKNPLDPTTKISVMREMYPEYSDKIVDDDSIRNILDILKNLCEEGYKKVNIVVGSDRQNEFEKLTNQYNNDLYVFEEINVISAGDRDPDSDSVEGISASKLRKFVVEGNYQQFSKGIPESFGSTKSQKLYKILRQSMNLDESCEVWEVAPKYDFKNLRENYLAEKIYKIGEWVENLNTGLIGKIIRRGTNYLICVTEDNVMFKPWIRDVVEWTNRSGVPANQREVGTDSLRKYVMSLTDTKKINNFNVKKFINKYKVKRT